MRPDSWTGQVALGDGWASFWGVSGDNGIHAHHALQLAVAPVGEVSLWTEGAGGISAPAVLVGADVAHRMSPGPVQLLYLDRESAVGKGLANVCQGGFRRLGDADRRALLASWENISLVQHVLAQLLGAAIVPPAPSLPTDSGDRVRRLIEGLSHRPAFEGRVEQLAAEVALSPSRFRHLVKDLVGMPVRPYLRWLRLRRALTLAAAGASVTQSAQDAGFADAAHLTRTARRHFGVTPGEILSLLRP